MIKFFRRIKQKLIKEGNLKRYSLYAIGEILLVVIGILIAMQLNTWNQKRLNEKEENRILQDISEELQYNLFLQEKGNKIMQEVVKAAESLLVVINKRESRLDTAKIDMDIHKLTLQWMSETYYNI